MDEAKDIDWRDAFNYLTNLTADAPCPFCGGTDWGVTDGHLAIHVIDDEGRAIPDLGFPVVALICAQCAFVRTHGTAHLRDLLRDQ